METYSKTPRRMPDTLAKRMSISRSPIFGVLRFTDPWLHIAYMYYATW